MPINPLYMITPALDQYFVDKDSGLPLAYGKLYFYEDESRTTLKSIYQITGTAPNYTFTALPNPLTLSAVGTIVNGANQNVALYLYPFDANGDSELYYVKAFNSLGVPQWDRPAWGANDDGGDGPVTSDKSPPSNQLANPQFSRIFLNDGVANAFAVSGTDQEFPIGPDWFIKASGTGTIAVTRASPTGITHVVTNPPYYLTFDLGTGITKCWLVQRFPANSGLWSSTATTDVYLGGSYVARNEVSGTTSLQMFYAESTGNTPVSLVSGNITNAGFTRANSVSASPIPLSNNTQSGVNAYVDIYIVFPLNSTISVTSLQVVPLTASQIALSLDYDMTSSNRNQALMGDYFIPELEVKRLPNYLSGWDFTLNSAHAGETGTVPAFAAAAYAWDRTILFGGAGTDTYARNAVTGGLQITTMGTNNYVAMLQYVNAPLSQKIIGTMLSVNLEAFKAVAGSAVTARIYLYRATAAGAFPTLPTVIASVAANGVATVTASGWTEVPRGGLPTPAHILPVVDTAGALYNQINDAADLAFSQWQLTSSAQIGDTNKFAILITYAYAAANTIITTNSVNVALGDIPARPLQAAGFAYPGSLFPSGAITDWVAYTPVFSASMGTVTGINFWSRAVGTNLEIRGQFVTPSGGQSGSEAQITLGFNGTSGNVVASSHSFALEFVGETPNILAAGFGFVTRSSTGLNYLTFSTGVGGAGSGGTSFSTSSTYQLSVSVRIESFPQLGN